MSEAQQQAAGDASDAARKAALAAAILKASQPPATTTAPIPSDYVDAPYRPTYITPVYKPPAPTVTQPDYTDAIIREEIAQTPGEQTPETYQQPVLPQNLQDYVDAPDRVDNTQGTPSSNPIVQVNEVVADIGLQQIAINEANATITKNDTIIAENLPIVEENLEKLGMWLEEPDKYTWTNYEGGLKQAKLDYAENLAALEQYNNYLNNRGIYAASIEVSKANLAALYEAKADISLDVGRQNLSYVLAMAGEISRLPPSQEELNRAAALKKWLASPEGQRALELSSQNTKWSVGGKEYDTYAEAEAAADRANKPIVPPQNLSLNAPDFFVDAPGMDEYVQGLGIPTTQSGIGQQGWVDHQIDEAAASLHRFGRFEEKAARDAKLAGDDLGAGLRASAAVTLGVASAVFDAGSWVLNPYPTDVVNMISEFGENPLFDTGYVGGNVALILYGASEIYRGVGSKLPKVVKDWAKDPDTFIDIVHDTATKGVNLEAPNASTGLYDNADFINTKTAPFGQLDDAMNPVATEWPIGSPEYNTNLLMGRQRIAYAMVELDEPLTTLARNLRTAAATPYYALDYPIYAYRGAKGGLTVASLISALGAASTARSLLADNQRYISEVSPILRSPSITSSIVTPIQVPIEIANSLSVVTPITASITEQTPVSDVIAIVDVAAIQEQPPIQEQVIINEVPVILEIPVPTIPEPPIPTPPEPVPPEELKIPLPILLDGDKPSERKEDRIDESYANAYRVTFTHRRRESPKTLTANSFHEALARSLPRGTQPRAVEVTLLGRRRR